MFEDYYLSKYLNTEISNLSPYRKYVKYGNEK